MRSIKELLQLMLYNTHQFEDGLCMWVLNMKILQYISLEEWDSLSEYIKENRPSKYSSFNAWIRSDNQYYWTPGNIEPRIKWLKKHIKLNS